MTDGGIPNRPLYIKRATSSPFCNTPLHARCRRVTEWHCLYEQSLARFAMWKCNEHLWTDASTVIIAASTDLLSLCADCWQLLRTPHRVHTQKNKDNIVRSQNDFLRTRQPLIHISACVTYGARRNVTITNLSTNNVKTTQNRCDESWYNFVKSVDRPWQREVSSKT